MWVLVFVLLSVFFEASPVTVLEGWLCYFVLHKSDIEFRTVGIHMVKVP